LTLLIPGVDLLGGGTDTHLWYHDDQKQDKEYSEPKKAKWLSSSTENSTKI
jgi:hypothetical protein